MRIARPQLSPPPGLRLPRRTARLRLTVLYGGVCLVFGAVLLTVTYLLTWDALVAHAVPQPGAGLVSHLSGPAARTVQQPPSGTEQITLDRQLLLTRSGIAFAIVSVAAVGAAGCWPAGCCAR